MHAHATDEDIMISQTDLRTLHDAGILDETKLAEITAFLAARNGADPAPATTAPRFDLTHVLWYAGALIIMSAMGLFTNEAFNRLGGWALAACGGVYAVVFLAGGHFLWRDKGLRVPAGLLVAVAVSMVPLIIFGVQDGLDVWKTALGDPGSYRNFFDYVNGSWIYMEIGTVLAAVLAVWRYPFAFILLVAAVALWFMSMDLALWFTRNPDSFSEWDVRRDVSMWFGLAMIAAAWATDVRRKDGPDFPFWIHIFGVMAFWSGLTLHDGGTELDKALYCLINIGLIGLSVFLNRRVYAVFGTLGIASYLGYLSYNVFQDVILFSFALSAIGLGVIGLGLLLHRNRARMAAALEEWLPDGLTWLRPGHGR